LKIRWDKDRNSATISYCIVVFWGVLLYFLFDRAPQVLNKISWFFSLMTPFLVGFVLAYFLNPMVGRLENQMLRFFDVGRPRPKLRRAISIGICLVLTVFIFVFLLFMFIPQLISSFVQLFNNFPAYTEQLIAFLKEQLNKYHIDPDYVQSIALTSDRIVSWITNAVSNVLPAVFSYSAKAASVVGNLIIGMIVSIYFLYGKEHFLAQTKKLIYALFPTKNADRIIEVTQLVHRTFINFIIGKLLDSLVVGILCFIGLKFILKMPSALLLAVIIGLSNFIPFFGPYIGAILSSLLVLLTNPGRILWFWLLVFILQQLDANIIDPRISGKSTGIPPVWVMFAIIVGGGMFGVIGLLVAVPAFAVFFVLFKAYAEKQLEHRGMPTDTSDYYKKGKIEGKEQNCGHESP